MKNKYHYYFNENEKKNFIKEVIEEIKKTYQLDKYDVLLIPETKNACFKEIVSGLGMETEIVRKNSKEKIIEKLETQKMMKEERKKLINNLQTMDDIKIGLISANQRMRVANLLFNIPENVKEKKVLFMDDSVFTGSTLKVILQEINIQDAVVLFSNKD